MKGWKLVVCVLALPLLAAGATKWSGPKWSGPRGTITHFNNRAELHRQLRSGGYKVRGGVDRSQTSKDDDDRNKSFPHFTESFNFGGQNYPFTMIGYTPHSGRTTTAKSVIVPLLITFAFFGDNQDVFHTFDPTPAVNSIANSPLYQNADFPNGRGQFVDQMQRAAFWNEMDKHHSWHMKMDSPRIAKPLEITVTPEFGTLAQDAEGNFFGDMSIDATDAILNTYIQASGIAPDEVPIFVSDDVTAEALGYHSASQYGGSNAIFTYIYTSWLDPALVDPIIADVSTINHELAEWANDPFINNAAPLWMYPPPSDPRTVCGDNPFLEVGDPQGNGPTFDDFPTIVVPVDGVDYHLQQLVLWEWFTGAATSSAFDGWWTFPAPGSITQAFVPCP
jgi:hypothetical protein